MPNAEADVVVVVLALSAATWWLWWRRWQRTGAIGPHENLPAAVGNSAAVMLAAAFIAISLMVTWQSGLAPRDAAAAPSRAGVVQAAVFNAALFVILLTLLPSSANPRLSDFGIHGREWRRSVRDGIETAMASFVPVFAVLLATFPLRHDEQVHSLLKLLQQDMTLQTLAAVVLAAVVLAPLAEELLFRVILLGWLKTRTTSRKAIVLSSLAFAAVHDFPDCLALLPLAVLLGCLYDRRGNFLSVFVAHAFFNLWNIVLTLAKR